MRQRIENKTHPPTPRSSKLFYCGSGTLLLLVGSLKLLIGDMSVDLLAASPEKVPDKYKDDLGPKEALDLAVKLANIDTSVHAMRRRGMRLPAVGDGVTDDAIVISDADRKIAKMTGADPKVIAEKRKAATVKG